MRDFIDWQDLTEATGVDQERIKQGKMSFEDKKGNLWRADPNGWHFSPRYATNAPKVSLAATSLSGIMN